MANTFEQKKGMDGLTVTPLSRPLFPGTVADLLPRGQRRGKRTHEQRLRDLANTQDDAFRNYILDLIEEREELKEVV